MDLLFFIISKELSVLNRQLLNALYFYILSVNRFYIFTNRILTIKAGCYDRKLHLYGLLIISLYTILK